MPDPRDVYSNAGERLVAAVRAIPDPFQRIRTVNELIAQGGLIHGELAQITGDTVRELHAGGMSYADIGRELGVTRARAEQLAKGRGQA